MHELHHIGLVAGYGVSAGVLVFLTSQKNPLWTAEERYEYKRPWLEFALASLAVIGVLLVGRAWSAGLLLNETTQLAVMLNQIVIFSPMGALLLIRRQPPETAWVPVDRIHLRLGIGVLLAAGALGVYALVTRGVGGAGTAITDTLEPGRLHHGVQVLLEDVSIAILLSRFVAAVRNTWIAVAVVSTLFALSHVPVMLSGGATTADLLMLGADVGIGVIILSALVRTRDVWWFWPVHTVLDLSQYAP